MAQLAEADDVYDHVLLELHAVVQRQLHAQCHSFWIVTVDVQHRRLHHLHDVRAVGGRTLVAGVRGGETNLVVDDDVYRAASAVTTGLHQRQGFLVHALASKSRVTVHQHRQHLLAFGVVAAIHARAHRAFDHRVHDFQVGRVERQRQVHRAACCGYVRAEALVVLHVTSGQVFRGSVIELSKQVLGHLAQGIHQHVQTTTVGHADHDFLDTLLAASVDQLVHRHDEGLTTFQREALLTHILGVQVALQAFSSGQAIENAFFLFSVQYRLGANGLQALLPPALLRLVGGIHEFSTDGAAVSLAQRIDQLAQGHGFLAEECVAYVEYDFQVGISEAVESRVKLRNFRTLGALEWVQISPALAHIAVSGNQLLHSHALAAHFRVSAIGHHDGGVALLGTLGKRIDDGQVGDVFGVAAIYCRHVLQGIKVLTPRVWNAAWVLQIAFVHLFDVRCVTTEEIGVALVGFVDSGLIAHIPLTSAPLKEALVG